MVEEIPLNRQRPAQFVFSRHVEEAMARIEAERKAAAERPSAAE